MFRWTRGVGGTRASSGGADPAAIYHCQVEPALRVLGQNARLIWRGRFELARTKTSDRFSDRSSSSAT
ncbi:hypothetical protein RB9199 [Rhodopirellula baltica SH 1]|uniref:Uncharacterized protein n=1 Tax=Rhodopirellula baltica (strain DSM 10527 / NCIMB 13988 / SH1) TaxID=243090 RepID=Q7ULY2_RHOBA|nr:hypothetical protein RB9199 [Rhodopirellula baltica SH 1]